MNVGKHDNAYITCHIPVVECYRVKIMDNNATTCFPGASLVKNLVSRDQIRVYSCNVFEHNFNHWPIYVLMIICIGNEIAPIHQYYLLWAFQCILCTNIPHRHSNKPFFLATYNASHNIRNQYTIDRFFRYTLGTIRKICKSPSNICKWGSRRQDNRGHNSAWTWGENVFYASLDYVR